MVKVLQCLRGEDGMTMIETMVVLPVIIMILFFSFNLMEFCYIKTRIDASANAGIDKMEEQGGYTEEARRIVEQQFRGIAGISPDDLSITATPYPVNYNGYMMIRISYDYHFNLFGAETPWTIPITGEAHKTSELVIR